MLDFIALAQATAAATPTDLGWIGDVLPGIPFLGLLALLWRVATWHSETDGRLKAVEGTIFGDGKGSEGCALRHKALDKMLNDAPTRGSMAQAFEKVRSVEDRAAEDRLKFTETLTKMQGAIDKLTERIDRVLDERREEKREATNPRGRIPTER